MDKKKKIIIGVIVLLAVALIAIFNLQKNSKKNQFNTKTIDTGVYRNSEGLPVK